MIDSIHIKNFQSHSNSVLELHKSVNVINGKTNCGKSSIVEAIDWCVSNNLRGDGFKSEFAKSNEEVSVTIKADNNYIERVRGKINGYKLNHTEYKALGVQVPSDIQRIINMGEINIQKQFAPMFFIQDSPGEVGRKINNVVGLEIIDNSLKEVNNRIRSFKNEVERCETNCEETQQTIQNLSIVDELKQEIFDVGLLIDDYKALSYDLYDLNRMIIDMQEVQKELNDLEEFLKVEKEVNEILKQANYLSIIEEETKSLNFLIDKISLLLEDIKDLNLFIELEERVNLIIDLIDDLNDNRSDGLGNLIYSIEYTEEIIYTLSIKIKTMENTLESMMGICPLCGNEVENDK